MTKAENIPNFSDVVAATDASISSVRDAYHQIQRIQANVERVFHGKEELVRLTLACVFGKGHVLLEDVPGVGKTTLALALAQSLGLDFKRIQFTSDLLPSDIIGVSVFSQAEEVFDFRPGPLFSQVVLADEINRTTPRTQSALLEAMSEGRVSVDNITYPLPQPFWVIATQNPRDHFGTYPLPESQLDRFLMRLSIGYLDREVERTILTQRRDTEPVHQLQAVMSADNVATIQTLMSQIYCEDSVIDYVMRIVDATRTNERIKIGVSTRGALAMIRAARAYAMICGREYVIPEDIQRLAVPCFAHRLSLAGYVTTDTREQGELIMQEVLAEITLPT